DNLLISNNTLSFTSSDIDLSTTSVYLVNTSSYSQNSIIHNIITENNYVNFFNAKPDLVGIGNGAPVKIFRKGIDVFCGLQTFIRANRKNIEIFREIY
ncbi:MAG: hypothetical protein LBS29_02685, partial [Endomicrobium sp.]|nr:hypothetical protein [Endomicrobium sp.]